MGAFNVSLAMRGKLGSGTPRGLAAKKALESIINETHAALARLCDTLAADFGGLQAKARDSAVVPPAAPLALAA